MSTPNVISPCSEAPSSQGLDLKSRIEGCWLGKSIGGTLGLPVEGVMERQNFSFYDPVPEVAPPNDDLELQLVWLHLVEHATRPLTQADFARAWREHIHYMWDEYGRCRWNIRRGVPVENLGTFENHFQNGMGSPIRSEIWACLFAGDPDSAAYYAALDSSLDHGVEGTVGEVFFAVMQSVVAAGKTLEEGVAVAQKYIPAQSEVSAEIEFVLKNHQAGKSQWTCWEELMARYCNENFTHAPLNVALTLWALCYGRGDFEKSILLAVNGGYDTDCTAATVGATLGLMIGRKQIPDRWIAPIGDGLYIGAGIHGIIAPKTIGELTERSAALVGRLAPMPWTGAIWNQSPPAVDLAKLPGTLFVTPADGAPRVAWANGELPREVKRAGGARWRWHLAQGEPREIVCLAKKGAKLYVDDRLIIECPAGLPYVPATHRSAPGSRVCINPGPGVHEVRVELGSTDADQAASVILAYPNLHLCPWTPEELPYLADLP
ncbi:MAG: ADP-ribosylglycohydrolase family protein [Chthoniobacteraceae bacterium]